MQPALFALGWVVRRFSCDSSRRRVISSGGRGCPAKDRRNRVVVIQRRNVTIINLELRRRFRLRISLAVEIPNAHDVLKSLRAHGAGIHAQAASDRARNSFHPFQPAQTRRFTRISDLLEFGADSRRDFVSGDLHPVEFAAARMNDHAANSSIADEQVRSSSDDEEREIFATAIADQIGEGRFVARLDPKLRRPAHAQRRVLRERLIKDARRLLRRRSPSSRSAITRSAARIESCSWMLPAPRLKIRSPAAIIFPRSQWRRSSRG